MRQPVDPLRGDSLVECPDTEHAWQAKSHTEECIIPEISKEARSAPAHDTYPSPVFVDSAQKSQLSVAPGETTTVVEYLAYDIFR